MIGPVFLAFVCTFAVQAELVQIVTPETVEYVTPLPKQDTNNSRKRDTSNGTMDSYLAALRDTKGLTSRYDPPEDNFSLYEEEEISYGPPQSGQDYGPPTSQHDYGPPKAPEYGPPKSPEYGPPKTPEYGPSKTHEYGPPKGYENVKPSYHSRPVYPSAPVMYGPPSPVSYLPPAPGSTYGIPFAAPSPDIIMSTVSNLLPKGLDLKILFKIAIKLVLFKMIVKFLAAICLLMAWPLFESKEKDEEGEERQLEAINDLTELVWNSIFPKRFENGTNSVDDEGIVEKVAGEINEKMTAPSEDAAIGFLEFCVNVANTTVGWMMSLLRRRNNTMDPLEDIGWKLWEKLKEIFAQFKPPMIFHS